MGNLFGALAAAGFSSVMLIFVAVIFFFYFIFFLAGITVFIFWIIALVDIIKRKEEDFPSGGENIKTVWVLLLIFVWVSSVPYYFLVIKASKDKPLAKTKGKGKQAD